MIPYRHPDSAVLLIKLTEPAICAECGEPIAPRSRWTCVYDEEMSGGHHSLGWYHSDCLLKRIARRGEGGEGGEAA